MTLNGYPTEQLEADSTVSTDLKNAKRGGAKGGYTVFSVMESDVSFVIMMRIMCLWFHHKTFCGG